MENTDSQTSNNQGGGQYGDTRGGYGGGPRRRFGGSRPFRPVPVRVGEEYDVKIESLSKRGDSGVARVQGLVIFVVNTQVGDNVKVRISKVGRGYATADVVGAGSATEATEEASSDESGSEDSSDDFGGDESTTTTNSGT